MTFLTVYPQIYKFSNQNYYEEMVLYCMKIHEKASKHFCI